MHKQGRKSRKHTHRQAIHMSQHSDRRQAGVDGQHGSMQKKASQRMYFLRKLKNFQLSNNLLYLLYQSVVQGILLYNQVYSNYSNARKADWERLDSMTTVARTIIRYDIRSPTAIYEEASLYKFMIIPCDRTHPLQTALSKARLNKAVHLKQSQDEQVRLH